MKKSHSQFWFKKVRGSYLPSSAAGRVIYFVYIVYLLALIISWFSEGYTAWSFITVVVPLSAAAAFLMQYIASKHSA